MFGKGIAAALVLLVAGEAQAEITKPAVHLKRTATSGREAPVADHIRWNDKCEPVPPIILQLDQPPSHGTVCVRVEPITIKNMFNGTAVHCIGSTIDGIRIIYLSRVGYVGPDEFKYSYQRLTLKRTVSINVVHADKGRRAATARDTAGHEKQQPGAIPACGALVS